MLSTLMEKLEQKGLLPCMDIVIQCFSSPLALTQGNYFETHCLTPLYSSPYPSRALPSRAFTSFIHQEHLAFSANKKNQVNFLLCRGDKPSALELRRYLNSRGLIPSCLTKQHLKINSIQFQLLGLCTAMDL